MAARLPRRPSSPSFTRVLHRSIDESWLEVFVQWLDFLDLNKAEETVDQYGYFLLRFLTKNRVAPSQVTEELVTYFLSRIKQKGSTVQDYLCALKSYYRWAVRRGIHEEDPVVELRFKGPKYPPAVALEPEELEAVVGHAARGRAGPRRAWAILLAVETGARVGSLAAVEPDDAGNAPGAPIHFNKAKGDRPYAVPLSPLAVEAVRQLRPFSNGTLLGVSKNTLWSWYHRAAVAAGLPRRKQRAHVLRDTFATTLLLRGVDLRTVQELLNHADLSQMHRYTQVVDPMKRAALAQPVANIRSVRPLPALAGHPTVAQRWALSSPVFVGPFPS